VAGGIVTIVVLAVLLLVAAGEWLLTALDNRRLRQELSRCRAAAALDEEACLAWFGVGLATLERIEAGEVEPSEEIARRLDLFLTFKGGRA
jgi:hypothetical protein